MTFLNVFNRKLLGFKFLIFHNNYWIIKLKNDLTLPKFFQILSPPILHKNKRKFKFPLLYLSTLLQPKHGNNLFERRQVMILNRFLRNPSYSPLLFKFFFLEGKKKTWNDKILILYWFLFLYYEKRNKNGIIR